MDITSITQPRSTDLPVASGKQTQLGKDDFLKLLTVQLRYQDPLNPLENTEFIAQMAQFTSLEQLQNMSGLLEQGVGSQSRLQETLQENLATSLIGRSIQVPTHEIEYDGDGSSTMSYRLPAGARAAQVQILDATGRLVTQIDLDGTATEGTFTWDGKSDSGVGVAEGAYLVGIQAEDHMGAQMSGEALRSVRVQGVRYTETGAVLWGDGVELPLDELRGVTAGQ